MADLSSELEIILMDFRNGTEEAIEKVANEVADEAIEKLKSTSPKKRPKYYMGWGKKKVNKAVVICNKKYPGLTHLLEHGHATRNGGRARAIPHIKPVEDFVIKSYQDKLKKEIESL